MPYKAKRAYFSARLKMFILRKTNKYISVFFKHYLRCIA